MHVHAHNLPAHLSLFSLIEIINTNLEIINTILDQRMNGVGNLAYVIIGAWKKISKLGKVTILKESEEMKVTFLN